jgi:hypothetical protein
MDEPTKKPKDSAGKSKKKTAKKKLKKTAPPVLYHKKLWKGVRDVYRCDKCPHCEEDEDAMKLHVLKHFPKEEREKQLDKLMR